MCEKRLKGAKGGKNDANRLAFAYIENGVLEGGEIQEMAKTSIEIQN